MSDPNEDLQVEIEGVFFVIDDEGITVSLVISVQDALPEPNEQED